MSGNAASQQFENAQGQRAERHNIYEDHLHHVSQEISGIQTSNINWSPQAQENLLTTRLQETVDPSGALRNSPHDMAAIYGHDAAGMAGVNSPANADGAANPNEYFRSHPSYLASANNPDFREWFMPGQQQPGQQPGAEMQRAGYDATTAAGTPPGGGPVNYDVADYSHYMQMANAFGSSGPAFVEAGGPMDNGKNPFGTYDPNKITPIDSPMDVPGLQATGANSSPANPFAINPDMSAAPTDATSGS